MNTILMKGILRRPLSFFDTTPIGVILNRATSDMGSMDIALPNMYQHFSFNTIHILSIFVVIAIGNPIIIVFFLIMIIWYFMSSREFGRVSVDLKRVLQITNSPLISVIAESVRGSTSLKAYDRVKYQAYKYDLVSEASVASKAHLTFAETFFFVKVELIMGGLAVFLTALSVVLIKITGFGYDGSSKAGTELALGLTWVTAITDWIAFTLFSMNYVSQGMSSAERIFDYGYPTPEQVE
jgi:ABC-type multidrug transport system fused ATPase/permease subunit